MSDRVTSGPNGPGGRAAKWLARGGGAALVLMMALTFCDVVGRYFFAAPIVGTVEVTELLMGMMIYLGIGLTTYSGSHIRVDILVLRLSRRGQAVCETFTTAICAVLAALICWHLWLKAGVTFEKGDLTQVWEWPVWPAAYVMAASSLLLLTALIYQLGETARRIFADGVSRAES